MTMRRPKHKKANPGRKRTVPLEPDIFDKKPSRERDPNAIRAETGEIPLPGTAATSSPVVKLPTWTPRGSTRPIPQNESDPNTGRRLLLD